MKSSGLRAFSLVEILISTLILSFIAMGLYSTLMAGKIAWQTHTAIVQNQQQARQAMDMMGRDFRVATNIVITPGTGTLAIAFNHPADGAVTYNWNDSDGDSSKEIVRQTSSRTRRLAQNVTNLSVTDSGATVLIDLTVRTPVVEGFTDNFQLKEKVASR